MSEATSDLPANWESVALLLASAEFRAGVLPELLRNARWFGGKAHSLREVRTVASLPIGDTDAGRLILIEAHYAERSPETYILPVQLAPEAPAGSLVIVRLKGGFLFDALHDTRFRDALFDLILHGKSVRAADGEIAGIRGAGLSIIAPPLDSKALAAEQSNSAILYGNRFFLKLYRKPEPGENPDAELIRFLSERQHFMHVPEFCGAIEHRPARDPARTLALLVANVASDGDAWAFTLAHMYDESYPARARQLGQRTAEMHLALAADSADPAFAPEPFTAQDWHSLCDSARTAARQAMELLEKKIAGIPDAHRADAAALLARSDEIATKLSSLECQEIIATKTRHHGDYHLGQVLNTGSDFVIIDFEGEPARSLAERRMKRSPLRDVAGMLRSFHYAAHSSRERSEAWAQNISRIFLDAWLATSKGASFLPVDPLALDTLLEAHLIEKAIYEISYELNHRPDWVFIPVRDLLQTLFGECGSRS